MKHFSTLCAILLALPAGFLFLGNSVLACDGFFDDGNSVSITAADVFFKGKGGGGGSGGGSGLVVTTTYTSIDITTVSATAGGSVSSSGGGSKTTERGVCYSTLTNPTTANFKVMSGSGSGDFTCALTGLTPNTTYFVRAYAVKGSSTTYGNEITFTTLYIASGGGVTDIDGNMYATIVIGSQEWTLENLKTTRYVNGDPIVNVTDKTTWSNLGTATEKGAYCDYGNNVSNVSTYGRLYNWYAVTDSRGLAPAGWRTPTKADWDVLESYLGGNTGSSTIFGVGRKLKETGTAHWQSPNDANNVSGFTALPGGYRSGTGSFGSLTSVGRFWSSSLWTGWAYFRHMASGDADITWFVAGGSVDNYRQEGNSVRCVKGFSKASGYGSEGMPAVAAHCVLNQNYPNPFNPSTTISYSIPQDGIVHLRVFDARGEEVAELENGYKKAGSYSVYFGAQFLPSGTYFYRLEVNAELLTGTMMLLK